MMGRTVVQNINPSILKWARERKHYEPAEVVRKLQIKSEEILADWETGEKAPTYPQLEKLADCYKVPIAVFFFPDPPEIEDAAASLRSVPGFDLDSISPYTMNIIHRVQAAQMALKEINDGVNPVSNPLHKALSLSIGKDIERLAPALRSKKFLNVSLEKQQGWDTYMDALWAWRDAVEEQGIFVFRWPFKSKYLSGFCLYDEEFPVICLDSQEPKGRQIFTMMHELAHLLHGESSVTLDKDGLEIREVQEAEYYFDHIAGAVLVPEDDLRKQISKDNISDKDFYTRQANRYKVSSLMFLVRCKLTDLIPYNVFTDMKESLMASSSETSGRYPNEGGGDYYSNQLSYWGKAFLQNVLHARYQNKIGEYETADILNMKIQNVEKIEGYLTNKQLIGV